ncbi:hypothetical protein GF324_03150 [bacterium]|nr:hypothetical protein [bacterium]
MRYLGIGILLLLVFTLTVPPVSAQEFNLSGNNEVKWADGIETIGGDQRTKRYFEDRLNIDGYYGNLRLGLRFTMLQPSEFGEEQTGMETLEKRFLEYTGYDGDLYVRAGHVYTVWGRGLTLALMEDIVQGFDSGLDGVHVKGRTEWVEAEAISGRSEAGYLGLVREAQASGAHVAFNLPYNFTLAGQALLVTPVEAVNSYSESRTWGGYLAYSGPVDAHIEHAQEYVSVSDDENRGTYAGFSTYVGKFGISLDYKNYLYYRYGSGLGSGSTYSQSVDVLPFHSAPIVQREFTSNLFGKHPHIVRFEDEVGAQVEVTWSPGSIGTLVLSMAQSSAHETEDAWLPSLKEEDSPYREVFAELQSYPSPEIYLIGWAGWNEELVYYNEGAVRSRVSWNKRTVLGAKTEYTFSPEWTVLVGAEGMNVEEIQIDDSSESHLEALLNLGFIYRANYSVTAALEMTGEENPDENRDTWFNVQARAFIANRHELLVTIGQERGGLVCTSGKCRLVTPFNGVKVTFTSLF